MNVECHDDSHAVSKRGAVLNEHVILAIPIETDSNGKDVYKKVLQKFNKYCQSSSGEH